MTDHRAAATTANQKENPPVKKRRNISAATRTREVRQKPQSEGEPIEILLVEDSRDDADLTMEALRDGKVRNRVTLVEDGSKAMNYLRREGGVSDAVRPDLILLDWHLPKKNGAEVLAEIKGDPNLKRIPVVIMTSSDQEKDIIEAYDRHANCYVTKPVDLDRFIAVVRSIESFWLTIVKLPAA